MCPQQGVHESSVARVVEEGDAVGWPLPARSSACSGHRACWLAGGTPGRPGCLARLPYVKVLPHWLPAACLVFLLPAEEDEEGSSSEEDDEAADAEVAELMRRHNIKPLPAGGKESKEVEALNPFELAEATSSEGEGDSKDEAGGRQQHGAAASGPRQRCGRDAADSSNDDDEEEEEEELRPAGRGRKQQRQQQQQQKRRKKSDDPMSIFASADDYAAMIDEDLAKGEGLDSGEQAPRGGRGGRGGGKRQRGRGGGQGGGRGAKQARRR